jgi:hypothetical protein
MRLVLLGVLEWGESKGEMETAAVLVGGGGNMYDGRSRLERPWLCRWNVFYSNYPLETPDFTEPLLAST